MPCTAYPHSKALSEELERFLLDKCVSLRSIFDAAIEIVQEYEHGSAEVGLLDLDNIVQYKNVMLDYLIFLTTYIELQEEMNAKTDHRGCHG